MPEDSQDYYIHKITIKEIISIYPDIVKNNKRVKTPYSVRFQAFAIEWSVISNDLHSVAAQKSKRPQYFIIISSVTTCAVQLKYNKTDRNELL
jgi:hypothetical protein